MSRCLLLWRHGRTEWNATGRAQGGSDIELDELGRQQAAAAATALATLRPTAIVSSDLRRAAATAQVLAERAELVVTHDRRLREIHFGEREGLTLAEAHARFPEQMERWQAGADVPTPGGEKRAAAAERYAAALWEIARSMAADDVVVVVSHGGVMRIGACRFLGLPQECWPVLGGFDNCHWAWLIEGHRGWSIEVWNAGGLAPELEAGDKAPA